MTSPLFPKYVPVIDTANVMSTQQGDLSQLRKFQWSIINTAPDPPQ